MSSKSKGRMAAAAFFLVALLAITPKAIAGDLMYGDATLTGLPVDGADVGKVQQCVSGVIACPAIADATGNDCKIAASDVLALQRYLVFTDLPVLPAKNPGIPPGCWAVTLTGPSLLSVIPGGSVPVTVTFINNVSPPRGGLDCAGVTVDFNCSLCPPGTTIDPSAVTDASCNATVILNAGGTPGLCEIIATVDLVDTGGVLLNTITVSIPVTICIACGPCSIIDVTPTTGCPGDTVTISGSSFGATPGSVSFDATPATVISWNNTSIMVDAPGGDFTIVTVSLAAGGSCILPGIYSYDDVPPAAPTISPTSGEYCVGQPINVSTAELGPEHCTTDGSVPDCTSPAAPPTIDSDMTLRCVECDVCNNLGVETTRNYTVDTVAVVSITSPVDGQTICNGDITVTGTADTDIPTVTVTSDQGHNESSPVIGGNWSVVLIGVIGPSIVITAQGTDACGNPASDSVTVPGFG